MTEPLLPDAEPTECTCCHRPVPTGRVYGPGLGEKCARRRGVLPPRRPRVSCRMGQGGPDLMDLLNQPERRTMPVIESPGNVVCRQRTYAEHTAVVLAGLRRRPAAELHRMRAHPDWEYATTEGPRKQWDYSDVPPDGDGWVRNVDASPPDGWERFEYTEESYWMRPKRREETGGA